MSTNKASKFTLDKYSFPGGVNAVGTVVGAVLIALSVRRKFIEPGSILHDQVLVKGGPIVLKYAKPVQDGAFYLLGGVHLVEAIYFAFTKLRKYNVKTFSLLWFQWFATVFAGGVFASGHFQKVVEEQQSKKRI